MNTLEQPTFLIPMSDTPDYSVLFKRDGKEIGRFDFSKSPATFTGDVDASAKLFVEAIIANMPAPKPTNL